MWQEFTDTQKQAESYLKVVVCDKDLGVEGAVNTLAFKSVLRSCPKQKSRCKNSGFSGSKTLSTTAEQRQGLIHRCLVILIKIGEGF